MNHRRDPLPAKRLRSLRLPTIDGRSRPRSTRCCSRCRRCGGRPASCTGCIPTKRLEPATGRQVTASEPNRITIGGAEVDVGFSVDLTIDPATQALAQMTAACYTGRQDVCGALGIAPQRGQRAGRRASDARRGDGQDGGHRGHRCGDRAHRSVGGCAFAVHAPRVRRSGTRARLRQAHALSVTLSPRRPPQRRRLSRCDARLGHQAHHGRGISRGSGRGPALARRRARTDERARARPPPTAFAAS